MNYELNKVSILIPVYGVEKYIERCARSVFGQTYHNLEIIFVDDCTPDKSIEILKRVLEGYPERKEQTRIIRHEKNRGSAAARNTAIDNATGEFVTFVDSDDWIELDSIEKMVKKQQETKADMVCARMVFNESEPDRRYLRSPYNNKREYIMMMMRSQWPHETCARLIRRSLFDEGQIRCLEGQNYSEDFRQTLLLAYQARSIVHSDTVVYHYARMGGGSLTSTLSNWQKKSGACSQNINNALDVVAQFKHKDKSLWRGAQALAAKEIFNLLNICLQYHKPKEYQTTISRIRTLGCSAVREGVGWKIALILQLPFSYRLLPLYLKIGRNCIERKP